MYSKKKSSKLKSEAVVVRPANDRSPAYKCQKTNKNTGSKMINPSTVGQWRNSGVGIVYSFKLLTSCENQQPA